MPPTVNFVLREFLASGIGKHLVHFLYTVVLICPLVITYFVFQGGALLISTDFLY